MRAILAAILVSTCIAVAGCAASPETLSSVAQTESGRLAPPTKRFSSYASYELKPMVLSEAVKSEPGKVEEAAKLEAALRARIQPLLNQWQTTGGTGRSGALLIEPRLASLKVVSGTARFWAGALAGDSSIDLTSSFMTAPPSDDRPPSGGEPGAEREAATHRQFFETRLHPRPEDERARLASVAEEPDLSAFCFDPVPAVIHRVLENPRTGLAHARLIAAHHRNPAGLEAVAARPAFLNDREVQRLLLRNIQSSEALVRRLLTARRLPQIYECCQSHDLPERHRQTARSILKVRFTAASPEERVELILTTEGRVLGTLSCLALDGRSVALICGRGVRSTLLAENLGRWPATPPPLIAYLLKHPLVRQAPALKLLLERHPNCPRSGS